MHGTRSAQTSADPHPIFGPAVEEIAMPDRRTTLLVERLRALAARKERFSYDVRGDSHVNRDIVAAYEMPPSLSAELEHVIEHALEHDAIVTGYRDREGKVHYTSCRLFTDLYNAMRFARENGQPTVFNWNRGSEVVVEGPAAGSSTSTQEEHAA
jgi:hypothetical protein